MRIAINAPSKRSLTPTEKKVYDLLSEENTPQQVSRITRIPYGSDNLLIFNPNISTIKTIIVSIREKGWEIPEPNKNKEENEMPRGKKLSPEKIAEVKALRSEGKSFHQIEEISGVSRAAAQRVCSKKSEPVQAATCTDSGVENLEIVSASIIPENFPTVKQNYFSQLACDAVYDKLQELYKELDTIAGEMAKKYTAIDKINALIDELDSKACAVQMRIDELTADWETMTGVNKE